MTATQVTILEPETLDKAVDWDAMEPDYRLGRISLRSLAVEYGCSEAAIRKHAKKYRWVRDLSAKVHQRAKEMVRMEEVRATGSQNAECVPKTNEERLTEAEIVEVAAVNVANVLIGQRKIIERHAKLACSLLDELEGATDLRDDFEHLGELLYAPDEKGVDKLNEIYRKVIALPGRVDTFKKLSDTLKTLIGLQRQAVGLSDNSNGEADKPLAENNLNIDNDSARRIAFILLKAERSTKA